MFPHVTFDKDIELDADVTLGFLGVHAGGINFEEGIYEPNPDFKEVDVSDNQAVQAYFKSAYEARQELLSAAMVLFQAQWDKVETKFIELTTQIFHGHKFPPGEYKGYVSITNCNPRFLEDKTFMIYYLTQTPNRTTSHELMHFMFYDYCAKKFPDLFAHADPNSGTYWSLAELFNNVLLSFSDYGFLNNQGDHPYPDHVQHYQHLVDMWNSNRDVDKFIPQAYKYLSESI